MYLRSKIYQLSSSVVPSLTNLFWWVPTYKLLTTELPISPIRKQTYKMSSGSWNRSSLEDSAHETRKEKEFKQINKDMVSGTEIVCIRDETQDEDSKSLGDSISV
jgi:hypothetical protein